MTTTGTSSSFEELHPKIQAWIWEKGWDQLRDAQELAVPVILPAKRDLIISAATAAGKTEAAFLPICSSLLESSEAGIQALYVGPLKALINDQFERLTDLCEHLAIPVNCWHGDVASSKKRAVLRKPRGILLITPESLEALFVIHGHRASRVFKSLRYVVVDELHAFIGTERGRQLQSLLHRLELVLRRRVARIGLSATLGDMSLAKAALRPGMSERVELIESKEGELDLQLQIRGYRQREISDAEPDEEDATEGSRRAIAQHLFDTLRGTDNLVFANSRDMVEQIADICRRLGDDAHLPNEFWAHHGSLAKEIREDVETRLKDGTLPSTAICTSTLELGIDIGAVKSVAQIGPPFSVAALRQRLGRSGRQAGEPAILRMYIEEPDITPESSLLDGLHLGLIQSIASIQLLLQGWSEPPDLRALQLSTLIQQIMSLIAQCGGVQAGNAWDALCRGAPFSAVDQAMFADLLRSMGNADLIQQCEDGTLLLGDKGERIVGHYSFFAAFHSADEVRVLHEGRLLGTVSPKFPLAEGLFLVLAGRRWRVVAVARDEGVVEVVPAPGGRVPKFESSNFGMVHDRVRQAMRTALEGSDVPAYLNCEAARFLAEARANFTRLGLATQSIVQDGRDVHLFVWIGDRVVSTIARLLAQLSLSVGTHGPVITIERATPEDVTRALTTLSTATSLDGRTLAAGAPNCRQSKYDGYLSDDLLATEYASRMVDVDGALASIRSLLE